MLSCEVARRVAFVARTLLIGPVLLLSFRVTDAEHGVVTLEQATAPQRAKGAKPDGKVSFAVDVVPEQALPGEPVAVYTRVTNRDDVPVMVVDHWPIGLYYTGVDGKRRRLNPDAGHGGSRQVELEPGESLRRKTWVCWFREERRREDRPFAGVEAPEGAPPRRAQAAEAAVPEYTFVFPTRGDYQIHASIGYPRADGRGMSSVSGDSVLRVRAPRGPDRQAQALLNAALPPSAPLRKGQVPFRPPSTLGTLRLWLIEPGVIQPRAKPVREEKGRNLSAGPLGRLREIYERFPETTYAWYAALVLARWEAYEFVMGDFYQKPARFGRAAAILKSIEGRALPLALREEVLALQAEVHYAMGKHAAADVYLKRLEAMEPAEPLRSDIQRIRRVWLERPRASDSPPAPR